jgi:hypothetical protein
LLEIKGYEGFRVNRVRHGVMTYELLCYGHFVPSVQIALAPISMALSSQYSWFHIGNHALTASAIAVRPLDHLSVVFPDKH